MSDSLKQDLTFALRSLRRSPLFTAAALLTLALGVGATTSMFSVVNGVLLKPLPYPDPDRAVAVATRWADSPDRFNPLSKPDLLDLAELPAFQTVVGYARGSDVYERDGSSTVVASARMTSGILAVFGLHPELGRDLRPEESSPGHPKVVMVSHAFWQQELEGDPRALGRNLRLEGEPYQVVGVAPEGFDFPRGTQIWRPHVLDLERCGRGCHNYDAVARISGSVPVELAREEAVSLADRLARAYPDTNLEKSFHVQSLEDYLLGGVRGQLWVLLGAVGMVLLVACTNVANLLLARAQERRAEMGIRASLGASRGRLTVQMLTESLVLAAMGGAMGLALALGSAGLVRRFAPTGLPRIQEIGVDVHVVLFTLALVLLVALLFGLAPALHLAGSSPSRALQTGRRGGSRGQPDQRFRRLLLGAEMAVSVVLLVGAGLLLKTLYRMQSVEPGFQVEDVIRFDLVLPESRYPDLIQVTRYFEEVEARIGDLPQVAGVGSVYGAPLGRWGSTGEVLVSGRPEPQPGEEIWAALRSVTPGYLDAQGIPVLRGRGILPSDREGTRPVALVNEAFVRRVFPGQDPLGQEVRVTVSFGHGSPAWTIVGIVPDVRTASLTGGFVPEVYVPHAQSGARSMTVVAHTLSGASFPLSAARDVVRDLDAEVPIRNLQTMGQVLSGQTAGTRFSLFLLSLFAVLALLMASVGLYGVVAYLVSMQQPEIGLRLALGAPRIRVVRDIMAHAAAPTVGGLAVGLGAALVGSRVLEGFLFQVSARDPLVYLGVSVLLVSVAAASTVFPARRASLVDPGVALREE